MEVAAAEKALTSITEYGILGFMVVLLIWYIMVLRRDYYRDKLEGIRRTAESWKAIEERQQREREEFNRVSSEQFRTIVTVVKENNTVLSELKSTIQQVSNAHRT